MNGLDYCASALLRVGMFGVHKALKEKNLDAAIGGVAIGAIYVVCRTATAAVGKQISLKCYRLLNKDTFTQKNVNVIRLAVTLLTWFPTVAMTNGVLNFKGSSTSLKDTAIITTVATLYSTIFWRAYTVIQKRILPNHRFSSPLIYVAIDPVSNITQIYQRLLSQN